MEEQESYDDVSDDRALETWLRKATEDDRRQPSSTSHMSGCGFSRILCPLSHLPDTSESQRCESHLCWKMSCASEVVSCPAMSGERARDPDLWLRLEAVFCMARRSLRTVFTLLIAGAWPIMHPIPLSVRPAVSLTDHWTSRGTTRRARRYRNVPSHTVFETNILSKTYRGPRTSNGRMKGREHAAARERGAWCGGD